MREFSRGVVPREAHNLYVGGSTRTGKPSPGRYTYPAATVSGPGKGPKTKGRSSGDKPDLQRGPRYPGKGSLREVRGSRARGSPRRSQIIGQGLSGGGSGQGNHGSEVSGQGISRGVSGGKPDTGSVLLDPSACSKSVLCVLVLHLHMNR